MGASTIAAGNTHSAILNDKGQLWTFGSNAYGQLGHGDTFQKNGPTKIDFNNGGSSEIVAVAAGGKHTLFIDEQGQVWSFGSNAFGQLGHGDSMERHVPTKIKGVEKVVDVTAGTSHTLILTEQGQILAFGSNFSGQLGLGVENRNLADKVALTPLPWGNDNRVAIPQVKLPIKGPYQGSLFR